MAGYLFYDGPSTLDGAPIIGVATTGSENPKTGPLLQTWILLRDQHPNVGSHTGEDASICGDCPLRGVVVNNRNRHRSCYVQVHWAPAAVWKAHRRNPYPPLPQQSAMLKSHSVRVGSYGDPVAIPIHYWERLWSLCANEVRPGYTHQWRDSRFQHWSRHLMASVESEADAIAARNAGWRTFRMIPSVDKISSEEILCPASPEAGNKATCSTCGACDGKKSESDGRRSVAIVLHGPPNRVKSAKAAHIV